MIVFKFLFIVPPLLTVVTKEKRILLYNINDWSIFFTIKPMYKYLF